jgi:hypothetical protein
MKKLIFLFVLIFMFTVSTAYAVDKTIVFAWDPHEQIDIIKNFEMHWSDQSGGPYAQLAVIPKADALDNQEPVQATVTGPAATTVTRYFVLKACGDIQQEDGSIAYECSGPSNEVSADFWIPFEGFKVPVNFRIVPES